MHNWFDFLNFGLQEKGFQFLKEISESSSTDAAHLIPFAQYNVGRAFYEGFGVKQSDVEAERWFLAAAQDGDPSGSIKAQTVLGLFYSRPGEEFFDLEKVCLSLSQDVIHRLVVNLELQALLAIKFTFTCTVLARGIGSSYTRVKCVQYGRFTRALHTKYVCAKAGIKANRYQGFSQNILIQIPVATKLYDRKYLERTTTPV